MATTHPTGEKRLIGPLGTLSAEEATAAVAKAAATRHAPRDEANALLERTGHCPLAVGVMGSTLKQAQNPSEWASMTSRVKRTFVGLQRMRKEHASGEADEIEDRITASIAAGLANMPEENQVRQDGVEFDTCVVLLFVSLMCACPFSWWVISPYLSQYYHRRNLYFRSLLPSAVVVTAVGCS